MISGFDARIGIGNVTSVWSVILENSGGGDFRISTGTFVLSGADLYYPIIKNKPSIRTSIDLAKSTAKTSEIFCHYISRQGDIVIVLRCLGWFSWT